MNLRFCLIALLLVCTLSARAADLRLGLIGLDTSHVIAFTRILNNPANKDHVPGAKVVAAFKGGSPDIESSWSRVDKFTEQLQGEFGVKVYGTIEEMLGHVDAVLLESVDGRPHLEQARPVILAGKPLFIDKPVAGSLRDAIEIYKLAKKHKVPCFSSSSLRYYPGVVEVKNADVGELRAVYSYGPASIEPNHPDLFWYGVHPTEALFTVIGRGCETVTRTFTPDIDIVTGTWSGGRVGVLMGLRNMKTGYKVTAFGTKAIVEQKTGGSYAPLVGEIVKFFQTGKAPVSLEETVEIFAFMEAADESKRRGGQPVTIQEVLKKNGW
jgi:hypothetical protein